MSSAFQTIEKKNSSFKINIFKVKYSSNQTLPSQYNLCVQFDQEKIETEKINQKEQIFVNQKLYEISKQMDIPFIITCDEHYLKKEDREIHADFLRSQDGDRELDDFYASTYLMDTNEIKEYLNYFSDEILQEAFCPPRKERM